MTRREIRIDELVLQGIAAADAPAFAAAFRQELERQLDGGRSTASPSGPTAAGAAAARRVHAAALARTADGPPQETSGAGGPARF